MGLTPGVIELHIEALVLHDIAPGDRARVGAAFEAELTRLFIERGVPDGLVREGTLETVEAGAFVARPGDRPTLIGVRAAQAVYEGLRQ